MNSDLVILAATTYWEATARYLKRTSTSRENLLFLAFAALIAVIWITLFLWDRRRSHQPEVIKTNRPLFEELCAAHGLNSNDANLLRDASQEFQLPEPAYVFVKPECLDQLSAPGHPHGEHYAQLRTRLFGP